MRWEFWLLLLIIFGFPRIYESRRIFGSTHAVIFPTFSPRTRIRHEHLNIPKFEYTVTTSTTTPPPPTTTEISMTSLSADSSPDTTTKQSITKPLITFLPDPPTTPKNAIEGERPKSRDRNFDWVGFLIVILITAVAFAFFVLRRKCASPSGTYRIPRTNLVPREHYVNFRRMDDDYIEIHPRIMYGERFQAMLGGGITNRNFHDLETTQESPL